nr:hypothetical protein [uncultured Desulfovibrio sp.]
MVQFICSSKFKINDRLNGLCNVSHGLPRLGVGELLRLLVHGGIACSAEFNNFFMQDKPCFNRLDHFVAERLAFTRCKILGQSLHQGLQLFPFLGEQLKAALYFTSFIGKNEILFFSD